MVGSLGKLPLGGHSFFCAHYLCGLQDLGYEVHYVERQNRTGECYDPSTGEMTDDPTYALEYLDSLPPLRRSPAEWERIEREFQEERDSWDG